ncbi:MAG: hypothetical protein ACRDRU_14245 [Pseudonocardiaceae bacterium]
MGTLGGFVLAMMVITGFEWASGETVGDQPGPQKPATPPPPPLPRMVAAALSTTPQDLQQADA